MAAGEKANHHLSFHGSSRRTGNERGERTEWTPAGVVLMLIVFVASTLVLMEAALSMLVRLSAFLF
jgi:hypothetical protein